MATWSCPLVYFDLSGLQEKQWFQQQLESTRSELKAAGQRVETKERELATLKQRERQLTDYQTKMESHTAETDTELYVWYSLVPRPIPVFNVAC